MNIPDEYFTDEQPQQCGSYIMRIYNGEYRSDSLIDVIEITCDPANRKAFVIAGGASMTVMPFECVRFCRLAPAAERDQLAAEVSALKGRIKELEDKRTEVAARNLSNMLYVEGLQKRIKRLEEAGDRMLAAWLKPDDSMEYSDWICLTSDIRSAWRKAKEAKP